MELPELTVIPSAADLADRFKKLTALQASVHSLTDAVHDWGLAVACGREGLEELATRCHAETEWLAKIAGTWLGHVREQADDALLARDWWSFGSQLSTDREEALRLRRALTAHRVVVPEVIEPSLIEGLRQAKDRLSESAKLGIFAGTPSERCNCARSMAGSRALLRMSICALEGGAGQSAPADADQLAKPASPDRWPRAQHRCARRRTRATP